MPFRPLPALLPLTLLLAACGSLKKPEGIPDSLHPAPAAKGAIAQLNDSLPLADTESAFQLLEGSREALEWRLALADQATTSIDAQYYIWKSDAVGNLLFSRLLAAADRGVQVRLLVDDLALHARDRSLAAICTHPNFEIRLFNPNAVRRGTVGPMANFLVSMRELNRRMHNKLFVVDGHMAVVGGRNIANEYFGLNAKNNFRDLDVLVAGSVVPEISGEFDEYWNSEDSVPGSELSSRNRPGDLDRLRSEADEYFEEKARLLASYTDNASEWSTLSRQFIQDAHRGEAHFLQDHPVPHSSGESLRLMNMIDRLSTPSRNEVQIVTPYLIPDGPLMEAFEDLRSRGIDLKILTGSMESNNHTIAHSHYKKYRRPLLEMGAELREYSGGPSAEEEQIVNVPPVEEAGFITLHFKTLVGDRERCFIGSLNLDPRALVINTENGLLIESPGLAGELADQIDTMWNDPQTWKVSLNEQGRMRWTNAAEERRSQPARGFGQRIADFFFQLLPIESQL